MNLVCAHCGFEYPLQNGLSLCPNCVRTETESLSAPKADEIGESRPFNVWRWLWIIAVVCALGFLALYVVGFVIILSATSWAK
jgi:hypothetical protein